MHHAAAVLPTYLEQGDASAVAPIPPVLSSIERPKAVCLDNDHDLPISSW